MIRFARIVVVSCALLGMMSCQKLAVPGSRLSPELSRLESRIMPLGGRVASSSEPILDKSTLRAEWEFETDWTKERYDAWLKNELASDFKGAVKASGLLFTRYSGRDFESMEITSGARNGKLRVRAVFVSYPD